MLKLKGDALCGGSVTGQISLAGDLNSITVSKNEGMRLLSGSDDHMSSNVFVFKGCPSADDMASIVGAKSSDCAAIFEQGSPDLLKRSAEMELAAVSGISPDYFRRGDRVTVDGTGGTVEVDNVYAREVVSCLVQSAGKTLILKRSERVGSWQGKWAAVSGYIEEGESPTETAFKEIREELSVEQPVLMRKGSPMVTRKEGIVWISHPFLFSLNLGDSEIKIDWEHTDFRWITLDQLPDFDTVPGLGRMLSALGLG